jgi:general secretion pathway protein D
VLNTILTPKGLAYQRVANGLSIVPLDSFPGKKPNQVTEYIKLVYGDPHEIEPTLKLLMSAHGDTKIIPSSKTILIIDQPENVAQVKEHVENLERLAQEAHEQKQEEQRRQREVEAQAQAAAQSSSSSSGFPFLGAEQRVTTVFPLRFATAVDVQEAVQNLVADGQVTAIENDNLLVVSGESSAVGAAAQLIRQLDVPRRQVRISAVLYDVGLDAMEQLGVNWRNAGKARINANGSPQTLFDLNSGTTTTGGTASAASTGTGTGTGTGATTATPTTSVLPTSPFLAPFAPTFIGGALDIYYVSRYFDVSAILLALDQTDGARLLARPNVLVYDRRPSEIKIISEIPVQQLTQTEMGGNIGTTTFREAGITLRVTPEIADDGSIRLTVAPEFSALQGFQNGQPLIDRRTATTTVRIMSGDTLVLGGLRRRSEIETVQGIPGLMNIKYLGNLFRSHNTTVTESELIIFIKCEIHDMDSKVSFREEAALQVTHETLEHIPIASHAPFIPPCNDPYCPYHNPRPRVWRGNVLAPNGEWPDAAPGYPPPYPYPYGFPPTGGPVAPAEGQPAYAPPARETVIPTAAPEPPPPTVPAAVERIPPPVSVDVTARRPSGADLDLRRLPVTDEPQPTLLAETPSNPERPSDAAVLSRPARDNVAPPVRVPSPETATPPSPRMATQRLRWFGDRLLR